MSTCHQKTQSPEGLVPICFEVKPSMPKAALKAHPDTGESMCPMISDRCGDVKGPNTAARQTSGGDF